MSQDQVAYAAGISQEAYGRYERGEREPAGSRMIAILRALKIPPTELNLRRYFPGPWW